MGRIITLIMEDKMSMTKKDYLAIAGIIKRLANGEEFVDRVLLTKEIVSGLADYFACANPRFDREKFITACMEQ